MADMNRYCSVYRTPHCVTDNFVEFMVSIRPIGSVNEEFYGTIEIRKDCPREDVRKNILFLVERLLTTKDVICDEIFVFVTGVPSFMTDRYIFGRRI